MKTYNQHSIEDFIKNQKLVHGEVYDYSNVVYINSKTKVEIKCKTHGSFFQMPYSHINQKCGCPFCRTIKTGNRSRMNKEEFLTRQYAKHGQKYDYTLVEWISQTKKIKIRCKECGYIFCQTGSKHLSGQGCVKCYNSQTIRQKTFVHVGDQTHGGKYTYFPETYINNYTKCSIKCKKCERIFEQLPLVHIHQKSGCPFCCKSKGESTIQEILSQKLINFVQEKTFTACINPKTNRRLRFDFFLPDLNICIEYDGIQHFKTSSYDRKDKTRLKERQFRDGVKTEFCKTCGIVLKRIRYDEDVEEEMKKFLVDLT